MNAAPSRATLVARLGEALATGPYAGAVLEPLPDSGLAHDHVRLAGRGALARVPKQSQMGLSALANLDYQIACFARASASGHAPRLLARLEPSALLPRGALLVEEIRGRPARLPGDLEAIVDALAGIHALPLPARAARPPLADPADPLRALAAEIDAQSAHLADAGLDPAAREAIGAVRARWHALLERAARPPVRLIAFDAHPGNFLVEERGRAVLVDLEKARYGHPPLDLAHATLYTSTTWDLASSAELTVEEVARATARWLEKSGEPAQWSPWVLPLREAMWLWAVSWCAKWRVLSGREAAPGADGEDWSASRSDAALVRHVRGRVDHYLSKAGVQRVAGEFAALATRFPAAP